MTLRLPLRRALAPIEMVLVLPMLLLLFAMAYNFAQAGLGRMHLAVKARAQAFRATAGASESSPLPRSAPFDAVTEGGSSGLVQAQETRTLRLRPAGLYPGDREARSRATVLADTWDHRSVRFQSDPLQPDLRRPLRMVTEPGVGGQLAGLKERFGPFLSAGRALESVNRFAEPLSKITEKARRLQDSAKKLADAARKIGDLAGDLADLGKKLDPRKWNDLGDVASSLGGVASGAGKILGGLFGGGGGGGSPSPLLGLIDLFRDFQSAYKDLAGLAGDIQGLPAMANGLLSQLGQGLGDGNLSKHERGTGDAARFNPSFGGIAALVDPKTYEKLGEAASVLGELQGLIDRLREVDP